MTKTMVAVVGAFFAGYLACGAITTYNINQQAMANPSEVHMSTFHTQNRVGKVGEADIKRFITTNTLFKSLKDVSNKPEYFKKGIDLITSTDEYTELTLDVKTDSKYEFGNFFFEIWSNLERETEDPKGCFVTTEADAWFYYFPQQRVFYIINIKKARGYVREHWKDLKQRTTKTLSRDKTILYHTKGVLVPRKDLVKLGIAQEVHINKIIKKIEVL